MADDKLHFKGLVFYWNSILIQLRTSLKVIISISNDEPSPFRPVSRFRSQGCLVLYKNKLILYIKIIGQ